MSKDIKEKVKEKYGKIALVGNSDSCCMPLTSSSNSCCNSSSGSDSINTNIIDNSSAVLLSSVKYIGYDAKDLESIPESSILGVGCGNPIKFAHIKEGDTVVDFGSGAGIDVFLSANIVKERGKVIGIDMTDEMLQKARDNAKKHGYKNVEFRQGDIENNVPVEDNSADVVTSNCVINLTSNKTNAFKEVYRILKPKVGKMVISDLVTDKEIPVNSIDADNWCSCIDGALTKENYIKSIREAGFKNIEILDEKPYLDLEQQQGQNQDGNGRKRYYKFNDKRHQ
ncbi:MAG: arsenite methyltransferase, partial [Candidatus Nitrosocosmicus sp.]